MDRRAFVVALAGLAMVGGDAFAQSEKAPRPAGPQERPRWGQQVEQEFKLGRGLGPQLMTEEEWKEHQARMRTMTAQERARYREETHQKMLERAKGKGIAIPPAAGGPVPRRGRRAPSR